MFIQCLNSIMMKLINYLIKNMLFCNINYKIIILHNHEEKLCKVNIWCIFTKVGIVHSVCCRKNENKIEYHISLY